MDMEDYGVMEAWLLCRKSKKTLKKAVFLN